MRETVVDEATRERARERHQPWCDPEQHALARADTVGASGCVGRYVQHGAVGGWVAEDGPGTGGGARFVIDFRPAEGWASLRPVEAAQLSGLLVRLLAEYRRATPARRLFARGRRRSA